jgi:hypothetical protein
MTQFDLATGNEEQARMPMLTAEKNDAQAHSHRWINDGKAGRGLSLALDSASIPRTMPSLLRPTSALGCAPDTYACVKDIETFAQSVATDRYHVRLDIFHTCVQSGKKNCDKS